MSDDHDHSGTSEPVTAPPTIICVDCGGLCHLLSFPDPDVPSGFLAGDIVAYRCEECLDRWDIELE